MGRANTEAREKQNISLALALNACHFFSLSTFLLFCNLFTEPVITYAPRDIITAKGSDVMFSCEVSSYPLASIQWSKEGNVISFPADDSSTAVQVMCTFCHF